MFNLIPYFKKNSDITRRGEWVSDIDALFDRFYKNPFFNEAPTITSSIRADVKETDNEYIIEAELPGVKKEDIVIDLQDNVLTLGVDFNTEVDEEKNGYIYRERRQSSSRRSFNVRNIDNENIKASYKDGILSITLPKIEQDTKTKKIEIE